MTAGIRGNVQIELSHSEDEYVKINEDHKHQGSALTQIAEHPQFTAINAFKAGSGISRSAFKVNDDIGVYLKYATSPHGSYDEYAFTFNKAHRSELKRIEQKVSKVFLALICVKGREICCLPYEELQKMVQERRKAYGGWEKQYTVLAVLPKNKSFRVYMNAPGMKKTMLTDPLKISRKDFPNRLFEQ